MPDLDSVAGAVAGLPYMTPDQGRRVYEHIVAEGARDLLELGTAHGVSTAYMALAAAETGGHVTTVDHVAGSWNPGPEEVLERAGLRDQVTVVRVEHSSYDWWLKRRLEERSDGKGNVEPMLDFCFLDGAHNWTVDGLAVVLVERLLRPGAWLLLDDLDWTYGRCPGAAEARDEVTYPLSDEERREPHMRAVFELIVKGSPQFSELRVQDDWFAWARKAPGEPRRIEVESTQPLLPLAGAALRRTLRRLASRR